MKNRVHDSEWRKGFEVLSHYDLSFEATIYDNQIDDLSELVGAAQNVAKRHF
jgi:predicted TIM-barrel fold metal-dependent hydrolase